MLKEIMQYFQAVQEGKKRANEAQMKLFDIAGFAMLTLTTKKKDGKFIPIGAENYCAAIHRPEGYLVILVDAEGYTRHKQRIWKKKRQDKFIPKLQNRELKNFQETRLLFGPRHLIQSNQNSNKKSDSNFFEFIQMLDINKINIAFCLLFV